MKGSILFAGLFAVMVMSSGCLCCNQDLGSLLGGGCNSPYIKSGSGCCLDEDSNGVCDSEESTQTTLEETTETTLEETTDTTLEETTETTIQETVTTLEEQPTTTIQITETTVKSTYGCVQNAGYDPNKVIFIYSSHCGNNLISSAETAAVRTGVDFQYINIGVLDSQKIKALSCFYGGYSSSNMEFTYCPRLLCPKTGEIATVDGTKQPLSQMTGFAKKCA